MRDWYASIGQQIRALRERDGVSQQAMADLLGIHRPAYSNIESGKRRLVAHEAAILADHFRVGSDFIIRPGPIARWPRSLTPEHDR